MGLNRKSAKFSPPTGNGERFRRAAQDTDLWETALCLTLYKPGGRSENKNKLGFRQLFFVFLRIS